MAGSIISNVVPTDGGRPRYPWQKPHQPNLTGTPLAYRPPGSVLRGGERAHARRRLRAVASRCRGSAGRDEGDAMNQNAVETVMGAVVLVVAALFLYFAYTTSQAARHRRLRPVGAVQPGRGPARRQRRAHQRHQGRLGRVAGRSTPRRSSRWCNQRRAVGQAAGRHGGDDHVFRPVRRELRRPGARQRG